MKGFFPFLHRVIEVKEALILPRFCRRRLFSADLHFVLASSRRHVGSNSSALDESTEVHVLKSSRECNIMQRRKGKKRRNSFNFNHNGVVKTRFKMYAFTPSALHFSWSYYLHSISLDHQNRKIKGVRLALRLSLRPQYNFAPLAFNKTHSMKYESLQNTLYELLFCCSLTKSKVTQHVSFVKFIAALLVRRTVRMSRSSPQGMNIARVLLEYRHVVLQEPSPRPIRVGVTYLVVELTLMCGGEDSRAPHGNALEY